MLFFSITLFLYFSMPFFMRKPQHRSCFLGYEINVITGYILLASSSFVIKFIALVFVVLGSSFRHSILLRIFSDLSIKSDKYWPNRLMIVYFSAAVFGLFISIVSLYFLPDNAKYFPVIAMSLFSLFIINKQLFHTFSTNPFPNPFDFDSFYSLYFCLVIVLIIELIISVEITRFLIFPFTYFVFTPIISGTFNYLRKGKMEPKTSLKILLGISLILLSQIFYYFHHYSISGIVVVLSMVIILPIFINQSKKKLASQYFINSTISIASFLALIIWILKQIFFTSHQDKFTIFILLIIGILFHIKYLQKTEERKC